MKLKTYITSLLLLVIASSYAQVGIGTTSPNAASMLDITSTNSGLLIPRVSLISTSDVATIASPVTSLLVYNSGFAPNGYYYWNGSVWVLLSTGNNSDWSLTGNTGTSSATNFFGTTDDVDIVFRRNNIRAGFIGNPGGATSTTLNVKNTSFGANSLLNPSTAYRNTAIGTNVMPSNTTGFLNTSIGDQSMFSNLTGNTNTVIGVGALYSNTSGSENVGLGRNALTSANASNNTALGFGSLRQNASGTNNVAIGHQAGYNETGNYKLYIENSTAVNGTDSSVNNALIYGEFDNRIVRTNGTIQIGNPATTGFALPTARGTTGNVLQTDGVGGTSWVAPTTLSITETDPQVSSATTNVVPKWNGTTLVDGVMTDDGTNVGVGVTPSAGNKLEVNGKTKTTNFQMTTGATANYVLQSDATGNASWALPNNTYSVTRTNLSANQSLGTSGWQKIVFNTVVFDLNTEFVTGTNRFVAAKTGYYEVNAGYHTDNQANTQYYSIGVYKNNALYQMNAGNHTNIGIVSRNIKCIVSLTAGDYIEIFVENYQSGVNLDSYSGKTYFEVKQIR